MALTQQQILERFEKTHGDRYDYSLVNFKRIRDNVTIICKEHGEFPQTVENHMRGSGCPVCARLPKTTEEFIVDAMEIHGDRYDYTLVNYSSVLTEVTIICRDHGSFTKIPNAHLNGQGCPACSSEEVSRNKCLTTEEFVSKCKVIRPEYDYSKVLYKRHDVNVVVVCPLHGDFNILPNSLLHGGGGCSRCSGRGYMEHMPSWFYIVQTEEFLGFGISNKLDKRFSQHRRELNKNNLTFSVVHTRNFSGIYAKKLEKLVKRHFKENIINTGIPGFRTEALPLTMCEQLLDFVENKTPPEGGVSEATT